jgi:hypothetical protein
MHYYHHYFHIIIITISQLYSIVKLSYFDENPMIIFPYYCMMNLSFHFM